MKAPLIQTITGVIIAIAAAIALLIVGKPLLLPFAVVFAIGVAVTATTFKKYL